MRCLYGFYPTIRTYTDDFSPCAALFFDIAIRAAVEESPAARGFLARARGLEKCVALQFALLAGRRREGTVRRYPPQIISGS